MGGRDSEVTQNTRRILLESAHFAPARVRRGARSLGLTTEASRRFERTVDANGVMRALNRASELLMQHANGKLSGASVDIYPQTVSSQQIALRIARCNALLGLKLSGEVVAQTLEKLTFKVAVESEGTVQVTVPSFRSDITREIDLIEEVARIYGYDKIPTSLPRGVNPMAGRSLSQRLEERAKSALLRCGLNEIVTLSMTNAAANERAGLPIEEAVTLRNPLSEDFTQLRTSLIPSLLDVLSKNIRGGARVFELGRVYCPQEGQTHPNEMRRLGMAMMEGAATSSKSSTGIDFFALKAVLETALWELGAPKINFRRATRAPFHPGRCAVLSIDSQDIGVMGEVHPEVRARYDLNQRAYIAFVDFDILARHVDLLKPYSPISRFPIVERDLALVLNDDVVASRVEGALRNAGGELLREARVFDIYKGAPIPENQKSVAIALRFQSNERTLKDEEVEELMTRLRQAAQNELGASLR
ncbi:MAG TPA: phenylalanine--tRNA ligase subunit beta, partial [Abditibacteriaceae bacterium]|nr:phenylalanine--tRNA ligase subunit beta [Abditibacteriaceae bacterium]